MVLPANYPLLPADTHDFCLIPLNETIPTTIDKIFLLF